MLLSEITGRIGKETLSRVLELILVRGQRHYGDMTRLDRNQSEDTNAFTSVPEPLLTTHCTVHMLNEQLSLR